MQDKAKPNLQNRLFMLQTQCEDVRLTIDETLLSEGLVVVESILKKSQKKAYRKLL